VLHVEGLAVAVDGRSVLHDVDLHLAPGEVHALFGPNASGKSALVMAIMGLPRYAVTAGRIRFLGEDITGLSADERARRGIALFFQRPPTVDGVSLRQLAELCLRQRAGRGRVEELAARLRIQGLLDRHVNAGFSGGEIRLSEMLQLLLRQPRLALVDEPDAGIDVDNLVAVGSALRELLATAAGGPRRAGLLITHTGRILDLVPACQAHLLVRGTLVRHGDARALLEEIRTRGYRGTAR
jgi:Fe-S cluster assembly ATP-binding protein